MIKLLRLASERVAWLVSGGAVRCRLSKLK
jgi:hypothetical protein